MNTPTPEARHGAGGAAERLRRVLFGDAVAVEVEFLERGGSEYVEFNLRNATDLTSMDFYFPLVILLAIFVLNMFPPGVSWITLLLNVVLVLDLFARIRRRPSGRLAVGLRPPVSQSGWGWAAKVYFASAPVLFAAGWLNLRLLAWLFPWHYGGGAPGVNPDPGVMSFTGLDWLSLGVGVLETSLLAPLTEEIWFRGIGLAGFMNRTADPLRAVLWTSLIFGLLHGPARFLFAGVFGLVLAMIRFRTGSLYCCMAVHSLHNSLALAIGMFLLRRLAIG